jgi:hypothetical protein
MGAPGLDGISVFMCSSSPNKSVRRHAPLGRDRGGAQSQQGKADPDGDGEGGAARERLTMESLLSVSVRPPSYATAMAWGRA